MKKELFGEICMGNEKDVPCRIKLTYYLLTDSVSEEYCDLKVYGVEIDKEEKERNGLWFKEKKIVKDLFFKREEAVTFLQKIYESKVVPMGLRYVINDYIGEQIQLCNTEKV